jgi:hypothetical protein
MGSKAYHPVYASLTQLTNVQFTRENMGTVLFFIKKIEPSPFVFAISKFK